MTTVDNALARREVWLTVALAIARDGMPEPREMGEHPTGKWMIFDFDSKADADAWAKRLGLHDNLYGRTDGWPADWGGSAWGWYVTARCIEERRPTEPALATEVIEAIGAAL